MKKLLVIAAAATAALALAFRPELTAWWAENGGEITTRTALVAEGLNAVTPDQAMSAWKVLFATLQGWLTLALIVGGALAAGWLIGRGKYAAGYLKAKAEKEGENLPARAAWVTITEYASGIDNQSWLEDKEGTIFDHNRVKALGMFIQSSRVIIKALEDRLKNALAERDYERLRANEITAKFKELDQRFIELRGEIGNGTTAMANSGVAIRDVLHTAQEIAGKAKITSTSKAKYEGFLEGFEKGRSKAS